MLLGIKSNNYSQFQIEKENDYGRMGGQKPGFFPLKTRYAREKRQKTRFFWF